MYGSILIGIIFGLINCNIKRKKALEQRRNDIIYICNDFTKNWPLNIIVSKPQNSLSSWKIFIDVFHDFLIKPLIKFH